MFHIQILLQFPAQLVELPLDGAGRNAALGGDDGDRLIFKIIGVSDFAALAREIGERLPHTAQFVFGFDVVRAVGRRLGDVVQRDGGVPPLPVDVARICAAGNGVDIAADRPDAVIPAQRTVDRFHDLRAKLLRLVIAVTALDGEAVKPRQVFENVRVGLRFVHHYASFCPLRFRFRLYSRAKSEKVGLFYKMREKNIWETAACRKSPEPLRKPGLALQPHRPIAVVEGAAAVTKLSVCVQPSECVPHTKQKLRRHSKRMVRREHPPRGKPGNLFKRLQIRLRVGGREIRRQHTLIR